MLVYEDNLAKRRSSSKIVVQAFLTEAAWLIIYKKVRTDDYNALFGFENSEISDEFYFKKKKDFVLIYPLSPENYESHRKEVINS